MGELDEGRDTIKTYCMKFSKNEFLKECKKIFKKITSSARHDNIHF